MYSITGTNIKLTKGDSFYCQVGITQGGDTYTPQEGDIIRFLMKKTYNDQRVLITKVIPNDTLVLYLEPKDTKKLDVGSYVYDIELTSEDGDVDTFIQGKFILTPEVN